MYGDLIAILSFDQGFGMGIVSGLDLHGRDGALKTNPNFVELHFSSPNKIKKTVESILRWHKDCR